MSKKTSFVCQDCGYDSPQWMGKCPECGQWNTLKEIHFAKEKSSSGRRILKEALLPRPLSAVETKKTTRFSTGFSEFDNVFGGGIVPGGVTLLAGDPGIGKSTLLLQVALLMSLNEGVVLYVSGEESSEQVKLRAERIVGLNKKGKNDLHKNFLLLSATDTDAIAIVIEELKPALVVIDSIQTMESENLEGMAGAVGQVRYATAAFIKIAKQMHIPMILVGHVTKEGMVAGPMVLSHMVDTVLFLEGEKATRTRILRSFKNRFGPVDEVGIFLMEGEGMKEVTNPEQLFLSQATNVVPGSILVATLEGTRAFLVEIQALVLPTRLPIPRRVASGIDGKRLELLLAVLQKHCNLPLASTDVFVNVAGGLKLADPACDLGICLAIFSSFKNINLGKIVAMAEVGLLGELRNVPMLEKREKEAKKLGFSTVISARSHKSLNQVLQAIGK